MSDLVCANNLKISLLRALNLPEHTIEFTLTARSGDLVRVKGTHYAYSDQIEAFERAFRDKAEVVPNETNYAQFLANFLLNAKSGTLILCESGGKVVPIVKPDDVTIVRVEIHNGKVFIDRASFRKWFGDELGAKMRKWMEDSGIVIHPYTPKVLSAGSGVLGHQTDCMELDLNHPVMQSDIF